MQSRLNNSLRNISFGLLSNAIMALIPLATRTIFIYTLGQNYLGIDSVFTNIITLLEIVNIGIGSAITYSVYKPISENNTEKCKTLFRLYRNCYYVFGCIIAIFGVSAIPFFDVLLKDKPDIPENIVVVYLIILFGTVSGYFFADKQCIFVAHQKSYVISRYRTVVVALINVIEIIALMLTRAYIVYLVIQTFQNLMINIFVARKAYQVYPYLKEKRIKPLERDERKSIVKNTSALMLNRVGNLLINGTDSLVLSSIVGVTSVGLYSNYFAIKNIINNFASLFTTQITSSIGNFMAEVNDQKSSYKLFRKVFLMNYMLYSFCSICLLCIIQSLIPLWIGEKYLLPWNSVVVIVSIFFFVGVQNTSAQFKAASGLYWQDRYRVIIEAIINLGVSIVLAIKTGLIGVFLGTLISHFLVSFWMEPYIIFKYSFHRSLATYYAQFLRCFIKTVMVGVICIYLSNLLICSSSILMFIVKALFIVTINGILHVALFWRDPEFIALKSIAATYLRKKCRGTTKNG